MAMTTRQPNCKLLAARALDLASLVGSMVIIPPPLAEQSIARAGVFQLGMIIKHSSKYRRSTVYMSVQESIYNQEEQQHIH